MLRLRLLSLCILLCMYPAANAEPWSGHLKINSDQFWFSRDHFATQLGYRHPNALYGDFRFNLEKKSGNWSGAVHYQASGISGEQWELQQTVRQSLPIPASALLYDDGQQLFNLADVPVSNSDYGLQHRLDRLWVRFDPGAWIIKLGRQAISLGNGMVFQPLDVIAPFAPGSLNTDYKSGNDMVYAQRLFKSGADLQIIMIPRRINKQLRDRASSAALKYRGSRGGISFDVLAGRHFDENLAGLGMSKPVGGALWRLDMLYTPLSGGGDYVSLVTNMDYSWTWRQKNVYGYMEYHFNNLGQDRIDLASADPALVARISRGEVFTWGRHHAAAGVSVELHPLFRLTPSVISNLEDASMLLIVRGQYDWKQNIVFIGGITLSLGNRGSEYGGIVIAPSNTIWSTGQSLYIQMTYHY